MIDIEQHVPADYFISIRGRQPDPNKQGKTKEAIFYVGWDIDAYERSKKKLVFTTKFGKSANFESAQDAYKMIFDPQFREAFQASVENDLKLMDSDPSKRMRLEKTSIDVFVYGASHVANVSEINPMDLI